MTLLTVLGLISKTEKALGEIYSKPEIKGVEVITPDYVLNVGDRLFVVVYSKYIPVVQYETFVDNEGRIPVEVTPLRRPASVKVVGLTLDSAQKVLLKAFRRYIPDITLVSIHIVSHAKFFVLLKGNFADRGFARMYGGTRLYDLVRTKALPFSSYSRVVLNGDTFNLWKFVKEGDVSQNPYLKANDTVVLFRTDSVILVSVDGGVYRTVEIFPGENVYDAVLKVRLEKEIYRFQRILVNGREADLKTPLNIGDTLVIETQPLNVLVIGGVNSPGSVKYIPYRTVQDYIMDAGGFSERANRWSIRAKMPGERKPRKVGLDYVPKPGEVVIVGEFPITIRDMVFLGPSIVSTAVLIYTTFFRR